MISDLVDRVLGKAYNSVKKWAEIEEYSEGFILYPIDNGPAVELTGRHVIDGLESFAESNLRSEDARFREVSRCIKREQFNKVKLNNKVVSAIVQHGVFGEEIF